MKKRIFGALAALFAGMLALCAVANAAVRTFTARGEYTMSDYETPSVAEERAFAYAKQSAAEQAGVYVASYTKSTGAQISEDAVKMLSGTLLEVKSKTAHKEATANGDLHIVVEIAAEMDTSAIDRELRKEQGDRDNMVAMYDDLQKEIARQAKENEVLKQKIAKAKAKGGSTENLVRESKAKEREFLSNQKAEEIFHRDWGTNLDWNDISGLERCRELRNDLCELLTESIRLNPMNAVAYYYRGYVYDSFPTISDADIIAKAARAIEDLTRAIVCDPKYVAAYILRGVIYLNQRDYDLAISDARQALKIDPKDETAQSLLYDAQSEKEHPHDIFLKGIAIRRHKSADTSP